MRAGERGWSGGGRRLRGEFDGREPCGGRRGGAFGPSRRAAAGFWHTGWTAQTCEELPTAATDPRRRASFRRQGALPGQADIGHLVTRQA